MKRSISTKVSGTSSRSSLLFTKFKYNINSIDNDRQSSLDDAVIYYGKKKITNMLRNMYTDISKYTTEQLSKIKDDILWIEKRYNKL